ncbi:hypothetical protein BGZ67_004106 [Mortierella alpina]|nr:hypothetical protein BGZ67_004106 [Mortierella alpina]
MAKLLLTAAGDADDDAIALELCGQAEISLDRLKKPKSSSAPENPDHSTFREDVAAAYDEHARFMACWQYYDKEQASLNKSGKWRGVPYKDGAAASGKSVERDCVPIPEHIFAKDNDWLTTVQPKLPEVNTHLSGTPQLAYCLAILRTAQSSGRELLRDPAALDWLQRIETNKEEQERLKGLVKSLVRAFTRDELKDADAVAEVTHVAPILERAEFRFMLKLFVNSLKDSALLEVHSLEGVARLMGSAPCTLEADDLVKTLIHINNILQDTHDQSEEHVYKLISTVSRVLDAMADSHVVGLEGVDLHKPLYDYLDGLKNSEDPYMVFQAAYAFQALLRVPDNESNWEATVRKGGRIINGAFQLAGAVKALDVKSFIDGLCKLQTGLKEIYDVAVTAKLAYEEAKSLYGSGDELRAALQEGLSFDRKRTWYTALRGTDSLLRNGQLAQFKTLVCEVPCRRALPFQWGICLRLGNLAVDGQWGDEPRCDAVAFLVELYKDDANWGHHVPVKQLILDILLQLSKSAQSKAQASSALLDRAQGIVDVEADLKRLRLACERQRVEAVYIPPMAKDSLQAPDTDQFDLKEKAQQFLNQKEKKVLLLLGESGVGKSTFNMELEYVLWTQYQKEGRIPLFISLPAIDQPEHDLISKQLRKLQFEESQIRELRNRMFVLICDGYDESQQTQNLYRKNRLNLEGEWQAQMVISCRTEYLGLDYKDQFQPGDRNKPSDLKQLQEAVVMPFSPDQIKAYIERFVALEKPLWSAEKYNTVLKTIPSLQELVKNPFLLKVSLDVLPRLVDPEKRNFAATANITRVALYDQFVEQWLERGKKRLVEKDMSDQERKAYEDLSSEGFARNGIAFLKKLASAIYDNQGGNPVIQYSRIEDEGSWKDKFFGREDEMQLLRDACPLARSGNQYRFIHRSILEYALARAEFEPRHGETGFNMTDESTATLKRRGSVSSAYSFELDGTKTDTTVLSDQGLDPKSPLALRSFVGEPSVLQFLEERAQQEPDFKKQLRAYVEASKSDPKWRIAAANAITILVRAGVQFNGADLQGIQIPGADLSFGVFDSAQLQKADLRKVTLSNVWLSKANLSQARMSGVEFGELPYLKQDSRVSRIAYSPDGKALVIVFGRGGVSVYSTTTWEKKWSVESNLCVDPGVLFSPNLDLIVYFFENIYSQAADVVLVREFETGNCRHTLRGHTKEVTGIAYSPRGALLASCSNDKTIRLWDAEKGTCRRILEGSIDEIKCVSFSPDGYQVASGGDDRDLTRLWDVETGVSSTIPLFDPKASRNAMVKDYIKRIVYSANGSRIALCTSSLYVQLLDAESREHIGSRLSALANSFEFSPSGDTCAAIYFWGQVHIWSSETGKPRHVLETSHGEYLDMVFTRKGDLIITGGEDQIVRLWDVETGVCRGSLSGHSDGIRTVALSPDGRHIASAGDEKVLRLWEVESGMARTTSSGFGCTVLSVGHSPMDESIISVNGGGTMSAWNMQSGECSQYLTEHEGKACSVAVSPRGGQIACGTTGGNIQLKNLECGDYCRVLGDVEQRDDAVNSIAYSPKGDQIASCSKRSSVKIWDRDGRPSSFVFRSSGA